MRENRFIPLVALTFFGAVFAAGPSVGADGAATDFIVQFHSLPKDRSHYGTDPVVAENDALGFLVVRVGDAHALERRASRDPNVLGYEVDSASYHALLTPADPLYAGYQYDLKPATTNLELAWDRTRGDPSVKVCVVDTGQYRAHKDFAGAHWAEWKDFVAGKGAPYDDNGHGTHVTGTIGAAIDNGRGVAGIAQVSLAGAKVLSRSGSGTVSAVASGISWCADIGAFVISLSLGGGYSSAIANAVTYATGKGALVVAAAGNDGPCTGCVGYPAALPDAFAVACTDAANQQCSFSSQGPEVDIAAPGKDIASTYPAGVSPCRPKNADCYVLLSGTSMSTPHVSGLAALVKSSHPAMTNADVRAQIQSTALDLGAPGPDPAFGAGLIQGAAVY